MDDAHSRDGPESENGAEQPRDPHILETIPDHMKKLIPEQSEDDQLMALESLETILLRIHKSQALAFDLGGVLLVGHNKEAINDFVWQVLGVQLSEEELEELHYLIFKRPFGEGGIYAGIKIGKGRLPNFEKQALSLIHKTLMKRG